VEAAESVFQTVPPGLLFFLGGLVVPARGGTLLVLVPPGVLRPQQFDLYF